MSNWEAYHHIRTTKRGTRDEIREFIDNINLIVNKSGQSESQIYLDFIEESLERRVLEIAESDECDPIRARSIRLRVAASQRARRFREFDDVYNDVGQEQFIRLCQESDVPEEDVQEYLLSRHWSNDNLPWSERAKSWIAEHLADGNPYPTEEIRQALIEDGLIDESKRDWARARKTAERMQVSGNADQGYWRLPKLSA